MAPRPLFINGALERMEYTKERRLVITDLKGTITELALPKQPDVDNPLTVLGADDGLVAFEIGNTFYLGDLSAGTTTPYTGKYADPVALLRPDTTGLLDVQYVQDGLIGIPLYGKDGQPYVVFLDRDMKETSEPVQMNLDLNCENGYYRQ